MPAVLTGTDFSCAAVGRGEDVFCVVCLFFWLHVSARLACAWPCCSTVFDLHSRLSWIFCVPSMVGARLMTPPPRHSTHHVTSLLRAAAASSVFGYFVPCLGLVCRRSHCPYTFLDALQPYAQLTDALDGFLAAADAAADIDTDEVRQGSRLILDPLCQNSRQLFSSVLFHPFRFRARSRLCCFSLSRFFVTRVHTNLFWTQSDVSTLILVRW